jgi:hypothetical protein
MTHPAHHPPLPASMARQCITLSTSKTVRPGTAQDWPGRTDLVFKTGVTEDLGQAGSIPVRLRYQPKRLLK